MLRDPGDLHRPELQNHLMHPDVSPSVDNLAEPPRARD